MRIALIYSGDGLDVVVLLIMLTFYNRIGYKTIYSKTFIDCHLLILPRPSDSTIIPLNLIGTPIHVWNYVGNNLTKFFERNKENMHNVLYLNSSSELTPVNYQINESWHLQITKPPVYSKLWTCKLSENKKLNLIHIGNFKPYMKLKDDIFAQNFLKSLRAHKAHVWGRGWDSEEDIINEGVLEVLDVSKVYANSRAALGLMYPFQRQTTFSGRFWHGPLNGSIIISEPGIYTNDIPGVYNSDLTPINVQTAIESFGTRPETIQDESVIYWDSHTENLEETVRTLTESFYTETLKNFSNINFYKKLIDNTLRNYYRQYRGKMRYIT